MKHGIYYILLFFIAGTWLSACTVSGIKNDTRIPNFQQLSSEIENSGYNESTTLKETLNENSAEDKERFNSPVNILKNAKSEKFSGKEETTSFSIKKSLPPSIRDAPGKDPIDLNKHNNFFWKFGGVLLMIGLGIFFLSGVILLKVNSSSGKFGQVLLFGLLIGLGLMIVSLPFILIGAIIGG